MESEGIKTIIYIDDGIEAFHTFELAKSPAYLARSNLISTVFVMNEDKSDFIPEKKRKMAERYLLRENCPNTELFLVCIFLHLDWIRRFME